MSNPENANDLEKLQILDADFQKVKKELEAKNEAWAEMVEQLEAIDQ